MFNNARKFSIISIYALLICLSLVSCYGLAVQERQPITWIDPDREQQNVILRLTDSITPAMFQNKSQRVAVLPFFDLNKRVSKLGRSLSIDLQSILANRGQFIVVERDLLDKTVISELKVTRSGLFDEAYIVKLGKLYGADTLVVGWVYDTGNSFKITVQVLSVERAKILQTAQDFISRNDFRVSQARQYIW